MHYLIVQSYPQLPELNSLCKRTYANINHPTTKLQQFIFNFLNNKIIYKLKSYNFFIFHVVSLINFSLIVYSHFYLFFIYFYVLN